MTADCAEWEFPPARLTAPGRRAYRRGLAKSIRSPGTNPREVEKAKEENTRVTNSRNRRLSQSGRGWRGGGNERKNTRRLPTHSPWSTSRGPLGVLERGEEPTHSVGTPLVECFGFGAAGRQTRVRKELFRSAVHSTSLWVSIHCAQEGLCSLAKEHCVVLGGLCAKSIYPLPGACKSSSSKVKGVGAVFSICLPVTKTDPQAFGKKRTHACACSTCWQRVHVPGQSGQEVVPWCSSSWTSGCSPNSSDEP